MDKLIEGISGKIVNPLVVVMFAASLVAFLWGVRGYITNSDNSEARLKGTQHMMWGIIGMSLMLMSFTIVKIVLNTFGISGDSDTKTAVSKVIGSW